MTLEAMFTDFDRLFKTATTAPEPKPKPVQPDHDEIQPTDATLGTD